jgi:hypothetical protein
MALQSSYNYCVLTGHEDRNSVIFTAFFVDNFTVYHVTEGTYPGCEDSELTLTTKPANLERLSL